MRSTAVHSSGLIVLALAMACEPSGPGPAERVDSPPSAAPAPPAKVLIQPEGYRPTPSPLSPGILVGNNLYLSGSTGGDPATGRLVPGGFESEMRQVGAKLTTVLEVAGMDLSNVVQVTTYLADMADYARYNEIYREYFTAEPLPTRATVAARELARGARVEMMTVAVRWAGVSASRLAVITVVGRGVRDCGGGAPPGPKLVGSWTPGLPGPGAWT